MEFLNKIEKIIKEIEDSKTPFFYSVLTFFFALILRNFIEIFSDKTPLSPSFFLHYDISYTCLALSLIILFHFVTKEKVEKIARIILPCFLIMAIAPILDLILSSGKGYDMSYLLPEVHGNLLLRFFTFFGSFYEMGITPGIRIEVGLVIFASFIYFFIKKKKIIRSLLFSFLVYSLIFIYLSMPFVVKFSLEAIGKEYLPSPVVMRNFYLLMLFILSCLLFYLYNKKYFIEIVKDIRLFRLLHFELMFVLGIVLANLSLKKFIHFTREELFYLPFILISILFSWLFSVTTNNITDHDIDRITNKNRPLVAGTIPIDSYKTISWIFLFLAVLFSIAVNFETLFLIILFIGNYFLYSMPPFRLKRIPFFSKLIISLNSLILLMLGYLFIANNIDISKDIIFFFLVLFTAAINFIDLKDYEGDKEQEIKTLPTIFGPKKSKLIIGSFFLVSYPLSYFILKQACLLPLLIFLGIIQFFFINRKDYKEKPVFITYLLSIFMFIIYLLKFYGS